MSGDGNVSREALNEEENKKLHIQLRPLTPKLAKEWMAVEANKELLERASDQNKQMMSNKIAKLDENPPPDNPLEKKAPAIIKERTLSILPPAPESEDVEYLTSEELLLEKRIHTKNTRFIVDQDANPGTHAGPWIHYPIGRNSQSGKMMVEKIPAKEVEVPPEHIMRYLGSVVRDRQSVHSNSVLYPKGRRNGYVFDCFYIHKGKRLERICLVENRTHQAGLMYEKYVHPKLKRGFARIRRIVGTENAMYEVVGQGEVYYRDLKRLFERHFLKRGEGAVPEDKALNDLVNQIQI